MTTSPEDPSRHDDPGRSHVLQGSCRAARAVLHPDGDPLRAPGLSPIGKILQAQARRRVEIALEKEGQ